MLHDDFFETVRGDRLTQDITIKWQLLSGFQKTPTFPDHGAHDEIVTTTKRGNLVSTQTNDYRRRSKNSNQDTRRQQNLHSVEGINNTQITNNRNATDFNLPPDDPNEGTVRTDNNNPMPLVEHLPGHRQPTTAAGRTRSGRAVRKPQRLIIVKQATSEQNETIVDKLHALDYVEQQRMNDPVAYLSKALNIKDTMYYHEAVKQPDARNFIQAIITEMNQHIANKHWSLINECDVPQGTKIIPAVWSMKRKRDISTREITKYKARLNVHGGKQEYGVNFDETYSPVVGWWVLRLFFTIAILCNLHARQVDFVLAYPQAPIQYDMYMALPKGIEARYGKRKVLKLHKNLYGQKQAGRQFHHFARDNLIKLGWNQSKIDECIFYKDSSILLMYVDDLIVLNKSNKVINDEIKTMRTIFNMEDIGNINDYLGVKVSRTSRSINLTQPHLIEQLIADVKIKESVDPTKVPAFCTRIIGRGLDQPPYDPSLFDYRLVIGKLNYLEKTTRPDISYAVHQCARYCSNPRQNHSKAVIHIIRYLKGTGDKGIILRPLNSLNIETFADVDWAGNWNKDEAANDEATEKSRSGYVVRFKNCVLLYASKLQTLCALSTCEAEYISLSEALRETIPVMELLKELKTKNLGTYVSKSTIHCTAFEDNSGALELAMFPKIRPRTKHINIKYHHFRSAVRTGEISVRAIDTKQQLTDIFTKPLDQNQFQFLRKKLLGW